MSGDIGAATLAAVGIALSPLPFLLAVALLGSDGAVHRAFAFVGGQALAVAAVCVAAVFLLRDGGSDGIGTSLPVLELAVGAALTVLLVVHLRRWHGGKSLRLHAFVDRVSSGTAFLGGLAMIVVNPKNLALALAGGAAILELDYSFGGEVASVVTFTIVSVSVLAALLLFVKALPEDARSLLDRVHSFVVRNEGALGTLLLAVLAAFFLVRGVLDAS